MPTTNRLKRDDQNASPEIATSKPSHGLRPSRDDGNTASPTTPSPKKTPGLKTTPKSAPAAMANRPRAANRKPPEPTLLTDFLRGRPSPARIAAQRKRRLSVEAVKAELRQEMRRNSVRRIPAPGGVRQRVQAWQKANASATEKGDPDEAATEPTDLAFVDDDQESVTEEDRVRIKMRAPKPAPKPTPKPAEQKAKPAEQKAKPAASPTAGPPKKRVVSDDNWRKQKGRKSPPRQVTPKVCQTPSPKPRLTPTDFVHRSAPNLPVSIKVKAWAAKVDAADSTPPRSRPSPKSKAAGTLPGRKLGDDGADPNDADAGSKDEECCRKKTKALKPRTRPSLMSEREASEAGKSPSQQSFADRSLGGDEADIIQIIEDPEFVIETPTRTTGSKRRVKNHKPRNAASPSDKALSPNSTMLDLTSSLANKSMADITGEIPFGHSAFSELDVSGKTRPKRLKEERYSHKSMPSVFKKVMEEGKKIIHDINEPPRQPLGNTPPSIENWLKNTVDPFVDSATTKRSGSDDGKSADKVKTRRTSDREAKHTPPQPTPASEDAESPKARPSPSGSSETAKRTADEAKTPSPGGLQRRRATRGTSSPLRSGGRRPLLAVLKEAFHGESTGHSTQPKSYQGHEERGYDSQENEAPTTHCSPDHASTGRLYNDGPHHLIDDGMLAEDIMPAPLKTRSPKRLSTILSEEDSSALGSDLTSDVARSTVTQSTTTTGSSEPPAAPSLQRRLTRHADLVSMLSLPENASMPSGMKDKRSRPSLRRTARGPAPDVTADELLQEFVDDENLYVRELKTLVDGVVPVLLSHVLDGARSTDLFGSNSTTNDGLCKAVVGMGVALEKLKNAHRKAPVSDIRRLSNWAHGLVPIYNSYLNAWRLGFEDVVVNLAPAEGSCGDDDSLLNALPRNDSGDVVNAQGERVAVAYLLKRPLMRVKLLARLFQCVDSLIGSADTRDLARDFGDLEAKARRRHREETARMTDEDAIKTDTSRARDLRTLEPATDSVEIDGNRQVSAKDLFSLSLAHSNGQRLECRVELVHRDRQSDANDQGDLLVREISDGPRSFLLFSPFSLPTLSARVGRSSSELILMARGSHDDGQPWHELLVLTGDGEDQIRDWLDLIPSSPTPPLDMEPIPPYSPETLSDPSAEMASKPLGPRPPTPTAQDSPTPSTPPDARRTLPSRYRPRASTTSSQPSWTPGSDEEHLAKTPTRHDWDRGDRSRPLKESMRPDPSTLCPDNSSTPRPLPPPPLHRSAVASPWHMEVSSPAFPAEPPKGGGGVKRRGSSPLKHEYLPSDTSSASGTYSSDDDFDSDSSDDEIESIDIPETELGVSIRQGKGSEVSESTQSLTPSHSASQTGWQDRKTVPGRRAEQFLASISRWMDKGAWKDISAEPCHVVVTAGLVEAYNARKVYTAQAGSVKPLLALDLTPLVLIRQSTALDLEVRSSVQPHCLLHATHNGGNFRFRCHNAPDCFSLYMSVHHARLNNEKFKQLENEARFRSFGERKTPADGDRGSGSRQRNWFGRRDSYRGSVRAPSQSQDGASSTPSSTPSASSFLRKLTLSGNSSFNIARSSVDRQGGRSCGQSLYTMGSSSSGGTPLRSPSASVACQTGSGGDSVQIRLHLLVAAAKWEDLGNCTLQVRRPPRGWHQALRANHGLEKRVTASTIAKKEGEEAKVVLDAVLGSGCFSAMGSRGIVCGVWEEVKDGDGVSGMAPATGATGGNIKKWCFQFPTVAEASLMLRLLHQEVLRA
ncbi:hypothetical protein L249_1201 [Ophiocordyceps polyrhachis-furcata BCC 54312]|uniref:SRm160/300 splicing coactivator n=1 Tax=Ophiocordyceps polyrhachis-furcata BCC 54312 TaxID=1330021 RepID=A0A367LFZ5_9HYPO|nr:hypothetical protein L249_1201 [Ophiocordyceps polyrhachis-furcata BCC 54312]